MTWRGRARGYDRHTCPECGGTALSAGPCVKCRASAARREAARGVAAQDRSADPGTGDRWTGTVSDETAARLAANVAAEFAKRPSCRTCGAPLLLGQPGHHYVCQPDLVSPPVHVR